jgi:hypothetical protein
MPLRLSRMLREFHRRTVVWGLRGVSRDHDTGPSAGNAEHLSILDAGVEEWNRWRLRNPSIVPNLSGFHLCTRNLGGIYLVGAQLQETCFRGTNLSDASLESADLRGAHMNYAGLTGAHLARANLADANLSHSNLSTADCKGVQLQRASLSSATLVRTDLRDADLSGCRVWGASAWGVILEGAKQSNLIITPVDQPDVEVDNLEIAQFLYLLLNNQKVRDVIDAITSKIVLILGRFTPDRKVILDAIREELRKRNYFPVLFDFEKPASRDLTETVRTLAHMARFVIADITDARSIPQELMAIVPNLPSVPVQPLLLASQREYGMFEHFRRYPWVLEPVVYENQEALLARLEERVIAPAEAKAKQQTGR